jgi:hypothetical protein
MDKPIKKIMQKEVDRKQFLLMVGMGIAAVTGFSTILEFFTVKSHRPKLQRGYGTSAYGGK